MNSYTVVFTDGTTLDIGQFPDDTSAAGYANVTYGSTVSSVISTPNLAVTTSALDPAWIILGLAAFLMWAASRNGKETKHVR